MPVEGQMVRQRRHRSRSARLGLPPPL